MRIKYIYYKNAEVLETTFGITVYIYFKDRGPPHVHVYYGSAKSHEASLTVEIATWSVLAVDGFSQKDVRKVIGEL